MPITRDQVERVVNEGARIARMERGSRKVYTGGMRVWLTAQELERYKYIVGPVQAAAEQKPLQARNGVPPVTQKGSK